MTTTPQSRRKGRDFIARHGETVFNAARRLQGDHPHTPLTRAGFAQADELGRALRDLLGAKPKLALWSSPSGRALQTLAVIAEHLELDWHAAQVDDRLVEIGMGAWGGRYYADVVEEVGPVVTAEGLLRPRARTASATMRSRTGSAGGSPTPMTTRATGWSSCTASPAACCAG